ncbi:MAG TPA: MgtC/SapB family protein [Planctomycetaceae bacterium]|jgi:putative Mg2+ transporter-C (MgtC) family protein|nr:MgtC/SapB family protein [Planctomycetaceae bacterium]
MSTTVQWYEIVFRLLLTVIGGALIGFNRTEHGRPAGLRTTMLVCLAASISMIQANLLMDSVGKAGNSFIVLDLMRLPLGILTGVGFIGAGAILRKENRVLGVTTAATLWFVTVMGLCFGGGQLGLGITALVIGLIVLGGLKGFESRLPQDRQGTLILTIGPGGIADDLACKRILLAGFDIVSLGVTHDNVEQTRELSCEVRWQARADKSEKTRESELLDELAALPGVTRLKWIPMGVSIAHS